MHQVIYFSSAPALFDKKDLLDILTVSRANNTRDGISGILLYKDGNILQVLEGEREAVERCFTRVERDPRHHGLIVVESRDVAQREFGDWSMGFRDLDEAALRDLPGYTLALSRSFAFKELASNASTAHTMLHFFVNQR